MTILFKYLPEKYVESFVREGVVLFRSLSYFRDYEDAQIRGDEFEGTRLHLPNNGLEITFTESKQKVILPHSLESTANGDDILVFCSSTLLSSELALKFKANACIEITNVGAFVGAIRNALSRRPSIKNKTLIHGPVKYYSPEESPVIDWALPEKIAMSKLNSYIEQQEYRFAFAVNGAFRIGNTYQRLVSSSERSLPRATAHPERILKLGNLSKLCKVHRFGEMV